jgi:hypothetical protein
MKRIRRVRSDPIEGFWQWWEAAGQHAAEAGLSSGVLEGFTAQISARVNAIHKDLAWELARGRSADHALIVTAAGIPDLRRIAEQWYQRSPAVSTTWEYHPARQADPDALANILQFAGHQLKLKELTFDLRVDNDRQMIEAVVFHPLFAQMPVGARDQAGMLAVDWALGEDGVTRWIGGFKTSVTRPAAGVPADGLIETVEALASRASQPSYVLMTGEKQGALVVASLKVPAKWIDHPLMDQHITVALPYAHDKPTGVPTPESLEQLRQMEDELAERLPSHARLVGHETTRGVRTLHLYADSDDRTLTELVRSAVSRWPRAVVKESMDPGWRAIRHLTG